MGAYVGLASTVLSTTGQVAAGYAADRQARSEAAQLNYNAGQVRAVAQRQSLEEQRQTRLMQSRLQAVAEGGGADVTVANLSQDIAADGEYRALTALYEGESRAQAMEFQADTRKFEGSQAKRLGMVRGISTVLDEGTTLYGKYGDQYRADWNRFRSPGDRLSQGDRRKLGVY